MEKERDAQDRKLEILIMTTRTKENKASKLQYHHHLYKNRND